MLSLLLAVATAAAAASPEPPKVDERKGLEPTEQVRLSLPTEDDVKAWRGNGLRVQLGVGYRGLFERPSAFGMSQLALTLRPSVRLDEHWSVGAAFQFGVGGPGLSWSGTVEPTFHPLPQLGLSAGVGYGGLSVSDLRFAGGQTQENVSRTLVGGRPLGSCTGSALVALARAEYLFVVGPLFASGPYAQVHGQWTDCEKVLSYFDPETGREGALTQWWTQQGISAGWWLTWR